MARYDGNAGNFSYVTYVSCYLNTKGKDMTEQMTAEAKALAAAEHLAAHGQPVTARAVREHARVRMGVATQVARAWIAQQNPAPIPMPDQVAARMQGIWQAALAAARAEFADERAANLALVAQANTEAADLAADVETAETERDDARTQAQAATARITSLETELARLRDEVRAAHQARATAEQAQATAQGIANGLRQALQTLTQDTSKPGKPRTQNTEQDTQGARQ